MKTAGIICEYNPFHLGHEYQLIKTRELTNADAIICIMSGSFMQRGEPSGWNKWIRAETAIDSGADLVIELPFVYAAQTAEIFARGAIHLLNATNVCDYLSFGSESGNIEDILSVSELLLNEPKEISCKIKEKMSSGMLYPKAYQSSIIEYLDDDIKFSEAKQILSNPNNILAIEYLKAILSTKSSISPVTIKRLGGGYNDKKISDQYSSATAIRSFLKAATPSAEKTDNLSHLLPISTINKIAASSEFVTWESFKEKLFYRIMTTDLSDLAKLAYINEGIENKIYKESFYSKSVEDLIERVKSKRYTKTNIQRMLTSILLNVYKSDIEWASNTSIPPYLRVLAMNETGKKLLRRMQKSEVQNIIVKTASFTPNNPIHKRMFELDLRSTQLFNESDKNINKTEGIVDFLRSPYIK